MKACSTTLLKNSSLSEEQLAAFGSSAYESMSQELLREQGLVTLSLLDAGPLLEGLDSQWMTTMVARGELVQKIGCPDCWVVAGASQYGALVARLFPVRDRLVDGGAFNWFSLTPIPGLHDDIVESRFEFIRILGPRAWRCALLEALSPNALQQLAPESVALRSGLVLKIVQARTVLAASAMNAFKGVSCSRLPWLAAYLGVVYELGRRPRTELQHLNSLLAHIFPD